MWAETSILEHLPNGGAVVAVIAVVVLFLKAQDQHQQSIRAVVDAFARETASARAEYREHVSAIMAQGLAAHRETRDAIRSAAAPGKGPPDHE